MTAGTTTGPSTRTPTNVVKHPRIASHTCIDATPTPSGTAPSAVTIPPRTMRRRPTALRAWVGSSGRRAASGLMRTTERVGHHDATTVTSTPPANAVTHQAGDQETAPIRSGPATARTTAVIPSPPRPPATRPSVEASSPINSASTRTARRSCVRRAPTARSSARSRERWANRIVNVLATTSTATNAATAANTSTRYETTSIPSLTCVRRSSTNSAVERTLVSTAPDRSAVRDWTSASDPPWATRTTSGCAPGSWRSPSQGTYTGAERYDAGAARPTTVTSRTSEPDPIVSVSPTSTLREVAARSSTSASSSRVGARPATTSCHRKSSSVETVPIDVSASSCRPSSDVSCSHARPIVAVEAPASRATSSVRASSSTDMP